MVSMIVEGMPKCFYAGCCYYTILGFLICVDVTGPLASNLFRAFSMVSKMYMYMDFYGVYYDETVCLLG